MPHLAPEHLAELRRAAKDGRKLRRVVITANIDGWTVGAFGALTAIFSLTDLPALALGVVMVVVAFVELRSAARLKRLDLTATRTLGWNQIVLGASLMTYAVFRLIAVSGGESPYAAMIAQEPMLAETLGSVEALTRQIMMAVYVCVIFIAMVAQGGLALYYFASARPLRARIAATPAWILEMQRAGVAV